MSHQLLDLNNVNTGIGEPGTNERRLKKKIWKNEAVRVDELGTKQGVARLGQKRIANNDEDWINGLVLNVKNTSSKVITFISISVSLFDEEGAKDRLPVEFPFAYGSSDGTREFGDPSSAPAPSGKKVNVVFSEIEYANLKAFLMNNNYPLHYQNVDI